MQGATPHFRVLADMTSSGPDPPWTQQSSDCSHASERWGLEGSVSQFGVILAAKVLLKSLGSVLQGLASTEALQFSPLKGGIAEVSGVCYFRVFSGSRPHSFARIKTSQFSPLENGLA